MNPTKKTLIFKAKRKGRLALEFTDFGPFVHVLFRLDTLFDPDEQDSMDEWISQVVEECCKKFTIMETMQGFTYFIPTPRGVEIIGMDDAFPDFPQPTPV